MSEVLPRGVFVMDSQVAGVGREVYIRLGGKSGSIRRWIAAAKNRFQRTCFRLFNASAYAHLGSGALIQSPLMVGGAKRMSIGSNVRIWHGARLEVFGSEASVVLQIGSRTSIQPFVHIGVAVGVEIGEDCLFASYVYITDHDHFSPNPYIPVRKSDVLVAAPVRIGSGVWLGERVCVLKGVTIGDGAIVGAASVVTKDIPPRSIAVGSPARVVKRWNDDTNAWERV